MPRMIPDVTFDEIVDAHGSRGEARVYEALQQTLTDSATVIYSVSWIEHRTDGANHDGEADFLIISPADGITVLEVKGGRVGRDAGSGRWHSWSRDGEHHEIRDPFAQAESSMYSIREKILELQGWNARRIPIGRAVAFPDSQSETAFIGFDAPREILVFGNELERLASRISEIQKSWLPDGAYEQMLSDQDVNDLIAAFSPPIEIRPMLGSAVVSDTAEMLRLTRNQFNLLSFSAGQPRASVSGGAGTGKTVLALEKARRLAASGKRTLLTCFNRPLGLQLESACEDIENLTAINFHELCWRMAEHADLEMPQRGSPDLPENFFDSGLAEHLSDAVSKMPKLRFDAILVDEGQDLRPEWWVAIEESLIDPEEGTLWVFHDENQLLFQEHPDLPSNLTPFSLTENLRNTRFIHRLATRYYKGPDLVPAGPEGQEVVFVFARDEDVHRKVISQRFYDLINNEDVAPHEIAVLTGRSRERSKIAHEGRISAFECTSAETPENGKPVFDTIRRFKGMERAVVILAEIPTNSNDDLFYVGITRARSHLIVIGNEELRTRIEVEPRGGDEHLRCHRSDNQARGAVPLDVSH